MVTPYIDEEEEYEALVAELNLERYWVRGLKFLCGIFLVWILVQSVWKGKNDEARRIVEEQFARRGW